MINLFLAILLIIVALAGGVFLGRYLTVQQYKKELADKPMLDENALRVMMSQMGQKPSEAKVQQAYRQIKAQQKQNLQKK